MKTKSSLFMLSAALILVASNAWAHKNLTNAVIGFSANPVTAGTSVTITGTLTYTGATGSGNATSHGTVPAAGTPVSDAALKIQKLTADGTEAGVAVACGTTGAAGWVTIADGTTDSNGQVSTDFVTAGLGGSSICFRTQNPAAGGSHGIDQGFSPAMDLAILIESACTPGATIAATLAAGDGMPAPGESGPWTFRMTVTACGALTGVTAQGGANGWAPVTATTGEGTIATRKETKKNTILLWTIGDMTNGQVANLDVTVDGTVPNSAPDCQVRYLSGPWSAISTNESLITTKSNYSGRVSVQVDAQGDGICP